MLSNRLVKNKVFIVLAIAFAVLSFLISYFNKTTTKELAAAAEIKLHRKETLAQEKLVLLTHFLKTTKPKDLFIKYQEEIAELYKLEGISIYVFENDSLRFWSDNKPTVDLFCYTQNSKSELIEIRNGKYVSIIQMDNSNDKCIGIALIAIKNEYDFENKYIKNNFSDWLDLPEKTLLKTDFNFLNPVIKSKYGNSLFEISRNGSVYKSKKITFVASSFALLSFLFLLISIYYTVIKRFKKPLVKIPILGGVFLLIRSVMIYFKIPPVLYETELFDATIFADGSSFYFSYLGDILINSFLLFTVSVVVYKTNLIKYVFKKTGLVFFVSIGAIILTYFSMFIRNLLFSLVNNSTITFNINELLNFTEYSFVGFLSIGLVLYAFYLLIDKYVTIIVLNAPYKLFSSLLASFISLVIYFTVDVSIYNFLWSIPLIFLCVILRLIKASNNFINIGLLVLVASVLISSLLNRYERKNKEQTYEALSYSLSDRQDGVAENEFTKVISSIKTDFKLKNLVGLLPGSSKAVEQNLRSVHLTGYFDRYEIILSLFKNDSTPIFKQIPKQYLKEDYFKLQIKNEGFQTICDELYFIDEANKPLRYIAKLDLENEENGSDDTSRLYIQMEPKNALSLGTFPDLLLDKSSESKLELKQISYASYENNKLHVSFGQYQYPLFSNDKTFHSKNSDMYDHYIYKNNNHSKVVISEIKFDFWQGLTSISYLFTFFSFLIIISVLFNSIIIKQETGFNSLNHRIQFILVSMLFLSLTGVVIGTKFVVEKQFNIKNENELITKSKLVLKELQPTIGQEASLDPFYKINTDIKLKELAQLVSSDIAMFDSNGMLYASSQSAIYEQGLISKFMNPIAYGNFLSESQASFSHRETIGLLDYISAYIPFYNSNDKLIGFINLPYFSRQKDLEKELTTYLTTLINIYTILFVIATLVALLVSNLLTKPLRIIKQQIANIKFGTHNEALKWHSKDEIGDLVKEYNYMLLKLEKSSLLLAQSERESAWREMAKQVAHEIKNPLTPMKLNIQHLQRVVATNPDDIGERVNRVSVLLIEQIDTLSHIATEFSNFAKLPVAASEKINLYEVLQNVTNLFQQNTDCQITLSEPIDLPILADREQCIRIFTNLLKNAEQAIPQDRKGLIEINAFVKQDEIIITIKDNGSGIEDEVKHKLFMPNFTTKTTGTGLGLAMVKSSITSFNGTISFESIVGSGTTFTLIFPKVS